MTSIRIADTQTLITLNTNAVLNIVAGLRESFDEIDDPGVKRKYLGAAVNQSIDPLVPAFKKLIPKTVTGNLRRSAAKKILRYENTAVGLVGYQMSHYANGGDSKTQKGWAQGFIEYGTDRRFTRGSIASSYNKRGAFEQEYMQNGEYETSPPYPVAFIKRAAPGQRVMLARSPEGGTAGVRPLTTVWKQNKRVTAQRMLSNLRKALQNAFAEQARRQARKI